jgi:hypothetical protein
MPLTQLLKQTAREIIDLGSKAPILADSKSKLFCESYLKLSSFKDAKLEAILASLSNDHGINLDKLYGSLSKNLIAI